MDEEVQMVEEFDEAPAAEMPAMQSSGDTYSAPDLMSTTTMTSIVSEITKMLTSTIPSTSEPDFSAPPTAPSTMPVGTNAREDFLFSTFDYAIFTAMLLLSALIGVYFGFVSKIKQNNTKEYLLGGKTMSKFPVSASLIATHVSGITMLGVPSEMYAHGTQYAVCIICALCVTVLMEKIYLPVFYDLQVTSVFTYLQKRFDRNVRTAASLVYALACMIYIPIVVYVPALAFSQVTGINLHLITPVICVICIFYTTVGGLRAVVWTDTLQFLLMIGATLAIIFLGIANVGGFIEVWEAADRGGRLVFFDMNPDPFVRTSFWTVTLGLSTMWVSNLGVSQGCVQRFLAVPDMKVAKNSLIIFTGGLIFIKMCSCFTGLLMYAKYESCDPYTVRKVEKLDQILPYYIMDVGSKIPGLPGLFVSGIFSAALSTMSSSLNTLAGTIYEDFIRHRYPHSTEKTASSVMKCLVVLLGAIVIGLVFVAERMGQVMHMAISLSGITSGALLGMFTSGMVSTIINTKGVISGAIVSVLAIGAIVVGAQMNPKTPPMPFRTDGCADSLLHNVTLVTSAPDTVLDDVPQIFKISFMYYSLLGVVIYFVVAYIVSVMTGGGEINDQRLLAPFMRDQKQYEKEEALRMHDIQYLEIDLALKELQKTIEPK
ncbi:sodium-coupled monocarboxylate transporter 1-like [Toxorhynchites rutilus septentrionalis]|uniref:sodium-coupled monocarboxylate transporter 1-like n=1 Tax=Toxorhynchites rutilus septentrionalis TaxID=329112 RepID=UPI002479F3AE|nr:sodium-coupled monocarboxylate transporter 1-like [Toxorhynchites rutilus septentrionalis]XP_055642807.1 sodium-coupled monocarboxylate transporter 1-like [Toxorhynchites rutilus septentrionalis]XP_055642808.1 sodium-coupled monocarboxylate transporter 1-like [Toxorhynchites rutilus septentrionalis]XP_055642809.1 sodium-coupled monocarboxylate transporter 1-like [Toxorhynchites rutilus septentrionalis]XP_055642810.1 sodium-coupled monocarboxylate transporter 1-like [Toxorhynchites rutilus se